MTAWSDADHESIWTPFDRAFRFRPSMSEWPGFDEPHESIPYHIGHAYGEPEHYEQVTLDLSRKLVRALRRCLAPDAFVYALDWQHPTYRFWPHRPFEFACEADWPIPALPNGDYHVFVEPNLSFGVLGHSWEQTMCVFGQALLGAFEIDMPLLFDRPLRVGGTPVERRSW
ncbi:MAG: DUF2716 domain-containing protein [Planctomycetota bacterium]